MGTAVLMSGCRAAAELLLSGCFWADSRHASEQVLLVWEPDIFPHPVQPPECSLTCELQRRGPSPFWANVSTTLTGYGAGVRYVLWRDGGREGEADGEGSQADYAGTVGTLLDAPMLTVTLDPALGACLHGCGSYGSCEGGSACVCTDGYAGARCSLLGGHLGSCPRECAHHGACAVRGERLQCECDDAHVGSYCTRATDGSEPASASAGATVPATTPDGSAANTAPACEDDSSRRGAKGPVDVSLRAPPNGQLRSSAAVGAAVGASESREIPVVQAGAVLADWSSTRPAGTTAFIEGEGSSHLSFSVSLAASGRSLSTRMG